MALYAFNGTWNSEKTDVVETADNEYLSNTNGLKFRDAYSGTNGYYTNGVGTRFGMLGRILGGAFGVGGHDRIDNALSHLRSRLAAGDAAVDVIGFSRGAALAIAFTNRVYKRVIDPRTGKLPVTRFLGLWDVVGSFGIPINLGPFLFQEYNLGYALTLPSNVGYCVHAMALDERRQIFRVTRLKGACEVWFRGAHSDVGGGNGNLGHHKIWPRDFVKNTPREIGKDDRIHDTVGKGTRPDCNDPHSTCVTETSSDALTATRTSTFKA